MRNMGFVDTMEKKSVSRKCLDRIKKITDLLEEGKTKTVRKGKSGNENKVARLE